MWRTICGIPAGSRLPSMARTCCSLWNTGRLASCRTMTGSWRVSPACQQPSGARRCRTFGLSLPMTGSTNALTPSLQGQPRLAASARHPQSKSTALALQMHSKRIHTRARLHNHSHRHKSFAQKKRARARLTIGLRTIEKSSGRSIRTKSARPMRSKSSKRSASARCWSRGKPSWTASIATSERNRLTARGAIPQPG